MQPAKRHVVLFILVLLTIAAPSSWSAPPKSKPRIILLCFDGADPKLVRTYNADPKNPKLPNLARLAKQGTFRELHTATPAQSPVTWSSFATGMEPGNTGIFDFLTCDHGNNKTGEPQPDIALTPGARDGTSFWTLLDKANIRPVVLNMPITYPAEPLPNGGRLTTGLATPDVRGFWGSWSLFIDKPSRKRMTDTGGNIIAVLIANGKGSAFLRGIDPLNADRLGRKKIREFHRRTRVTVEFHIDHTKGTVALTVGGRKVKPLKEGAWSDWVEIDFQVAPKVKVSGTARFYLTSVKPLSLYMSPIQYDPAKPPQDLAISTPRTFSRDLHKAVGPYPTLGWPIPSNALKDEKIDEAAFLSAVSDVVTERRKIMNHQLAAGDWQLFASTFTFTDRVQHMMWRLIDEKHPRYEKDKAIRKKHGDAIFQAYKQMDDIVGGVLKKYPDDILIVMSDHGFASYRRGLNINTWLVKAGFMTLKNPGNIVDPVERQKLFTDKAFFRNVDWSKTRAYSLGLGNIYINLRGRETKGIVDPKDRRKTKDEIAAALLKLRDLGALRAELTDLIRQLHGPDEKVEEFSEQRGKVLDKMDLLLDDLELNLLDEKQRTKPPAGILDAFDTLKDFCEIERFAAARQQLKAKLAAAKQQGRQVVRRVFQRDVIYKGQKHLLEAPDMNIGFHSGWRVSWNTALGGMPPETLSDNSQKWSGDHCSTDPQLIPGMFLCNRKVEAKGPNGKPRRISIRDIAPSVLQYYGLKPPGEMDGLPFEIK